MFLVMVYRGEWKFDFLCLMLFLITAFIKNLIDSPLYFYRYGAPSPQILSLLEGLIGLWLILFFLQHMRACRKVYFALLLTHFAAIALSALSKAGILAVGGNAQRYLESLPQATETAILLSLFVMAIFEAREKNAFFQAFAGFSLAVLCVLAAVCAISIAMGRRVFADFSEILPRLLRYGELRVPRVVLRCILVLICILLTLWRFVANLVRSGTILRVERLKERLALESYDNLRQYTRQTMILRHDVKRHFAMISAFLAEGKIEKARAYAGEISGQMEGMNRVVDTGNELVDTILGSKLGEAVRKGARVEILHSEAPEKMEIGDADLCSLMLNILDNALAALDQCAMEKRAMEIDLHVKRNYLYFSCENSASDPVLPRGEEDSEPGPHGCGLRILERVTEKYGGVLDFEVKKEAVRVSVAIPFQRG